MNLCLSPSEMLSNKIMVYLCVATWSSTNTVKDVNELSIYCKVTVELKLWLRKRAWTLTVQRLYNTNLVGEKSCKFGKSISIQKSYLVSTQNLFNMVQGFANILPSKFVLWVKLPKFYCLNFVSYNTLYQQLKKDQGTHSL